MSLRRPRELKELISYRLHVVANLSSRIVEAGYGRRFGLTLLKWRALAVLGSNDGYSLKELGIDAGLDKGLASRTVSELIEDGLVEKHASEADRRSIELALTAKGRDLYEQAFGEAAKRHQRWLSVLTPDQQRSFFDMLSLMTGRGLELLEEEKRVEPEL
jgi:DNA-binding MarR family transcriptional regulator